VKSLCKHQTFKLADHQRPEQFGQTSTSWVATVATGRSGLPWHTVVSQQSDAAQHLYDPLMHPGGLADFMLRRSNHKRSQASEKLASFWLAKIESQGCKMLWMNTPLNLWSLQVLTYFTCDILWSVNIPWNSIAALGPLQPPPRSSQGSVQPGPDEPDSWILLEITWNYWYFNLWIYEYKLLVDSSRYVYIIL
jgi:hypothetical protein